MNREMLMLVDAISREKNVERDVVFGAVEAALARIPVVKSIYSSVKQVSDTLFSPGGEAFRAAFASDLGLTQFQ